LDLEVTWLKLDNFLLLDGPFLLKFASLALPRIRICNREWLRMLTRRNEKVWRVNNLTLLIQAFNARMLQRIAVEDRLSELAEEISRDKRARISKDS
jgi:hypothetical protein